MRFGCPLIILTFFLLNLLQVVTNARVLKISCTDFTELHLNYELCCWIFFPTTSQLLWSCRHLQKGSALHQTWKAHRRYRTTRVQKDQDSALARVTVALFLRPKLSQLMHNLNYCRWRRNLTVFALTSISRSN